MKLLCLFLLFYAPTGHLSGIFHTRDGKEKIFLSRVKLVLKALEKAVSFYEQFGDDLNLDACFGLRIAEGWR